MLKSLKSKFILIGAILLFSQIAVQMIGSNAISIIDKISDLDKNVYATRSYMEADMMHDAMRSDVLAGILAIKEENLKGIESAKKDLDDHYANFKEQLVKITEYNISDAINKEIQKNTKDVDAYALSGKKVLESLANGESIEDSLKNFEAAFESLEEKNAAISDLISEQTKQEKQTLVSLALANKNKLFLISSLAFLIVLAVIIYPVVSVFRPLNIISGLMDDVAKGELSAKIPYTHRDDEVGELAKSLTVFKQNAHDKLELEERQKLLDKKAVEDRKQTMLSLANNFENSVKHIVDAVASASTEMHSTSSGVANIAQDSSSQISKLVDVLTSTSGNVQTVASATTELSASIQEISRQMSRSATITTQAVSEAAKAEQTVQQLSAAAAKIGEVVSLISDIASQINLLALNATIESARAGEAGKGFAVVASEVKNLAGETSKATDEIAAYIKSIQESTAQTVEVIGKVGGTIREINVISTTIASAVEEQGVATQSIANNVEATSQQTNDVTRNIGVVQSKANETGVSASEMLAAASELSIQAEKLRREVDGFLAGVRKS
jgi:methyl-accepting chemotaxis protein